MATHPIDHGTTPTTESEPVFNEQRAGGTYGVVNGRPLGETAQTRRRDLAQRYKFVPQAASRLRAATKRALGT